MTGSIAASSISYIDCLSGADSSHWFLSGYCISGLHSLHKTADIRLYCTEHGNRL